MCDALLQAGNRHKNGAGKGLLAALCRGPLHALLTSLHKVPSVSPLLHIVPSIVWPRITERGVSAQVYV
jgi:hypothetical protein